MNKGYRINIKNLHYAVQTKDDSAGVTYDEIIKIPGMMDVTITPTLLDGKLYGDGVVRDQESMLESLAVALNINKLSLKDRATMRGNYYENGELEESADDKAPYIALGWEVETTAKPEMVWLYKGKVAPLTDEQKQREGNITYNTNSLNIVFIPREYDGKIRRLADGNDEELGVDVIKNWFDKVPGDVSGVTPPEQG